MPADRRSDRIQTIFFKTADTATLDHSKDHVNTEIAGIPQSQPVFQTNRLPTYASCGPFNKNRGFSLPVTFRVE
jgi:hypothetical protein